MGRLTARGRRAHHASIIALAGALAVTAGARTVSAGAHEPVPNRARSVSAPLAGLYRAGAYFEDRGIRAGGFLQLDGSHVLSGGLPHPLGFDAQRLLELFVTIDTRKLAGWPGGTLFVDAQSHSGANVITHQVPALADPDNMDAYSETSLDRAWFRQDFLARKLRVRLGLMYVDD